MLLTILGAALLQVALGIICYYGGYMDGYKAGREDSED